MKRTSCGSTLRPGPEWRRGAPDKTQTPSPETVEVECPFCAAVLCLDARVAALRPEVLCAGCEATIPIAASDQSLVLGP